MMAMKNILRKSTNAAPTGLAKNLLRNKGIMAKCIRLTNLHFAFFRLTLIELFIDAPADRGTVGR